MMKTEAEKRPFVFTGWHMAAAMGLFFGTIIVVNFGMAYMASQSWTGLVVKNSYVASQKFNVDLAAAKRQTAKGWNSKLTYENGALLIKTMDRSGQPLALKNATLSIGRPAFEQRDQTLVLSEKADGQSSALILLDKGEWFLQINGTIDGKPYRRDARILVNDKYMGELQ